MNLWFLLGGSPGMVYSEVPTQTDAFREKPKHRSDGRPTTTRQPRAWTCALLVNDWSVLRESQRVTTLHSDKIPLD